MYYQSPLHFAFNITKNYGFEFVAFNKIREFKDGITFFEFILNLDLYKADHSPKLQFSLMVCNWMIFEMNIYNLHHRDEEE